ncbi:chemotaxis protein methyltransferase CheR [Jannaschia faecimaris]|uniref:protein-glutamate O-methyltransferase n=2 Tax=Jannaschia faecimaris TaxID=1244108 RepID=A0A1H3TA92_9RHOB|nr:chemotaxis protein methyltransferase CheR [Jannaschia faecimaris]
MFVASRLQRRLRQTGLRDFGSYLELICGSGPECRAERMEFVAALTTNVTGVYREPHHFALLADQLRSSNLNGRTDRFQIWSAGCSSGEEPLSMAATCMAVLGTSWAKSVEILATDVDRSVLAKAHARTEEPTLINALKRLPDGVREPGGVHYVKGERLLANLLEGITWQQHNLLHPLARPDQFDVIFCRNVTIYFSRAAQEAVHSALRARLGPNGLFAIGHSEQLLGQAPPMVAAGRTAFRRLAVANANYHSEETRSSWR